MTSNHRARRTTLQLEAELAAIASVGRAVNGSLSMGDITEAALSGILAALRADLAVLFLRDGDQLTFAGAAPTAMRQPLDDIREHRLGECLCGVAAREKTAVFSKGIPADPRCPLEECGRAGFVSFAAVPLVHGDDVIGVIGLASVTERDFEERREFLDALAGLATAALVNARLHERSRILADAEHVLQLFQYSIDQASDSVFWMNRDGGFSYVNDQACRVLGYTRDELLQLRLWDIAPSFPKSLWFERWEAYQADRRGGAQHFESSQRRKDGTEFPVEVVSKHLWLGDVELHVAFVRDITERKRMEHALREKTEELDRFFTTTLDLLCVADTEGYFRRLNPQWEAVLGYSLAELEGSRFLDFIHPDDLADTMEAVSRLDAQQPVLNFVNRYRCRDGSYRWLEWRSSGQGKRIYAAVRDITDHRQAEDALRASLEEKVVLLKEVHHRVKNNLQIISSLLNLQSAKTRNAEVQDLLRDTQGRIRAMAVLHETLYGSDNLARVNVRSYVQSICAQVVRSFLSESRDISLVQDVADVMLPLDQAIPVGLILNELLSNAFKHAFVGRVLGTISVQVQMSDHRHCVLRVADDGVGLPTGAGGAAPGSIGLLLVESLARQLEGELTVSRDAGTTFQVVFPVQPAQAVHP